MIVACVIGDGEAETGPLATAWQSNEFLDPVTDGAVLPILHFNGYKISNPTVLARIDHDELEQFIRGCGWSPYFVEGDDPATMHEKMATSRAGRRGHQADPGVRLDRQGHRAAAMAGDRPEIAQGLDRAEDRRRPARRGHVPLAPGAAAGRRPSTWRNSKAG